MRRTSWGSGAVWSLVAAAAWVAVPPAVAAVEQPEVFGEVLEVRVVNLEAVVTDRQGARVRGLAPGDFRLWVDGEPVTIDFFTEVEGGVAGVAAPGAAAIPAAVPGQPIETSYLVFVDDYFPLERDRDRVLANLRSQLGHLAPQDRMAVVAWDGRRLDMLTSWTSSQPALARALDAAAARPAGGLFRDAERRSFDGRSAVVPAIGRPAAAGLRELSIEEGFYAGVVEDQVHRAVGAVSSTLRAFAAPPGRKVLVLLSGGWPASPEEWATGSLGRTLPDSRFAEGEELFDPLVQTANLLGYTIYAVDVPGMSREQPVGAQHAEPVDQLGVDVREQALHHSLSLVARPTGGRALLDGNREAALEAIAADTRSYYWLGFTADRRFDEGEHDVRLEVTRPGLRLRHRAGYRDFSREREATMAVESALLFGTAPAERTLPLHVGAARRAGIGKVEIPLRLEIPVDALTFVPAEGGFTAAAALRVAALDAGGATSPVAVMPFELRVAERPEPGSHLRYETSLRLRRDRHDVVVALHDAAGGFVAASGIELDPR